MTLQKITGWLLVAGTLCFMYWPKVYKEGFFIPIRFEILFALAALFFISTLFVRSQKNLPILTKKEKIIYITLIIFIGAISFSTIFSYYIYNLPFNFLGLTTLLKISLGIVCFLAALDQLKNNPLFYTRIAWAFTIPSLLLIPLLAVPSFASKLGFISPGYRFQGPTSNPSTFDFLAIIAFSFLASFLLHAVITKAKRKIIILYVLFFIGTGALIFWTQSRSYTIAMLLTLGATVIFHSIYHRLQIKYVTLYACAGLGLVLIAFLCTPIIARKLFIHVRILGSEESGVITSVQKPPQSLSTTNDKTPVGKELFPKVALKNAGNVIEEDPRVVMWKYYLPLIPQYPFGWGVNYQPVYLYPFHYNDTISYLPPVFIVNIWAIGGVIAVVALCSVLWYALKGFKKLLLTRQDPLLAFRIGAMNAFLISWFISLFYGVPVEYIGFWILFALALPKEQLTKN